MNHDLSATLFTMALAAIVGLVLVFTVFEPFPPLH